MVYSVVYDSIMDYFNICDTMYRDRVGRPKDYHQWLLCTYLESSIVCIVNRIFDFGRHNAAGYIVQLENLLTAEEISF